MQSIRMIFFDLDGTLLSSDHETVSARTRAAVWAAHEAGAILSVATGRCRDLIPACLQALPFDYYLTSNGADVYDVRDGSHPVRIPMAAGDAQVAWAVLQPFGFFAEWFVDGGICVDGELGPRLATIDMPHWHRAYWAQGRMRLLESVDGYLQSGAPGLEKINVVRIKDPARWDAAHRALVKTGRFELSSSLKNNIEINGRGCTKGEAIRRLCAHLGIPKAQTAAFGDGNNDTEMLHTAGLGVAMGNAGALVRDAACIVTESNDQDGVAAQLERWLMAGAFPGTGGSTVAAPLYRAAREAEA